MWRLAWVFGFVAILALTLDAQQPVRPKKGKGATVDPGPAYVPPKADGPVVSLLDENVALIFNILNNDTVQDTGPINRDDRDVFAGIEAVWVAPSQKSRRTIPGWSFRIVETPKQAGEFRYVRFAWKKLGGTGIMIQFFDPAPSQWDHRLYAGRNAANVTPAICVTPRLPIEWEVVTRDLFQDFGEFTITGLALTASDGAAGLFDHVLLGRTVADLDQTSDEALGRVRPMKPLEGKERDELWGDLLGSDPPKTVGALRAFLAAAPDQVSYIREHLPRDTATAERIVKLVEDLDNDNFDSRVFAADELVKIGSPAIDAVKASSRSESPELRYRAAQILKRIGGGSGLAYSLLAPMARVDRILERAATPEAKALLSRIADGEFGPGYAADAKAALNRLEKSSTK